MRTKEELIVGLNEMSRKKIQLREMRKAIKFSKKNILEIMRNERR